MSIQEKKYVSNYPSKICMLHRSLTHHAFVKVMFCLIFSSMKFQNKKFSSSYPLLSRDAKTVIISKWWSRKKNSRSDACNKFSLQKQYFFKPNQKQKPDISFNLTHSYQRCAIHGFWPAGPRGTGGRVSNFWNNTGRRAGGYYF